SSRASWRSRTRTGSAGPRRAPPRRARVRRACARGRPWSRLLRQPAAQRLRHLLELLLHRAADRELGNQRLGAALELDAHARLLLALDQRDRAAQLLPDPAVADLLEAHVAFGRIVEVEGGGALATQRGVVARDRLARAPAADDLGARLGEQRAQHRVVGQQRGGLRARAVDVELLLHPHDGLLSGSRPTPAAPAARRPARSRPTRRRRRGAAPRRRPAPPRAGTPRRAARRAAAAAGTPRARRRRRRRCRPSPWRAAPPRAGRPAGRRARARRPARRSTRGPARRRRSPRAPPRGPRPRGAGTARTPPAPARRATPGCRPRGAASRD